MWGPRQGATNYIYRVTGALWWSLAFNYYESTFPLLGLKYDLVSKAGRLCRHGAIMSKEKYLKYSIFVPKKVFDASLYIGSL